MITELKWISKIDVDVYDSKIPDIFFENIFVYVNPSHPFQKFTISFEMLSKNILKCKIIDNGMNLNVAKKNEIHQSKDSQLAIERIFSFCFS